MPGCTRSSTAKHRTAPTERSGSTRRSTARPDLDRGPTRTSSRPATRRTSSPIPRASRAGASAPRAAGRTSRSKRTRTRSATGSCTSATGSCPGSSPTAPCTSARSSPGNSSGTSTSAARRSPRSCRCPRASRSCRPSPPSRAARPPTRASTCLSAMKGSSDEQEAKADRLHRRRRDRRLAALLLHPRPAGIQPEHLERLERHARRHERQRLRLARRPGTGRRRPLQNQNSQLFGQEQSDVAALRAQEGQDVSTITGTLAGITASVDGFTSSLTGVTSDIAALATGEQQINRRMNSTVKVKKGGSFADYYKRVTGKTAPTTISPTSFIYEAYKAGVKAAALKP